MLSGKNTASSKKKKIEGIIRVEKVIWIWCKYDSLVGSKVKILTKFIIILSLVPTLII